VAASVHATYTGKQDVMCVCAAGTPLVLSTRQGARSPYNSSCTDANFKAHIQTPQSDPLKVVSPNQRCRISKIHPYPWSLFPRMGSATMAPKFIPTHDPCSLMSSATNGSATMPPWVAADKERSRWMM
ncbi:unnamed protein product, partial [Ectocarpus sp. 13 AM-2016]